MHAIRGPVADAMVLAKALYGGGGKRVSRAAWAAAVTLVFGDRRRSIIRPLQKKSQVLAFHAG
jgi:hypothetical protein